MVGDEVEPPAGAEEAIELIHQEYTAAFDSPRREVSVTWVESLDFDGPRLGWSTSCADIWIKSVKKVSDSALAHEMAHCYSGDMPEGGCVGSYDNSHSVEWVWSFGGLVVVTKEELRAAGL
jgi:hypothetical protein